MRKAEQRLFKEDDDATNPKPIKLSNIICKLPVAAGSADSVDFHIDLT